MKTQSTYTESVATRSGRGVGKVLAAIILAALSCSGALAETVLVCDSHGTLYAGTPGGDSVTVMHNACANGPWRATVALAVHNSVSVGTQPPDRHQNVLNALKGIPNTALPVISSRSPEFIRAQSAAPSGVNPGRPVVVPQNEFPAHLFKLLGQRPGSPGPTIPIEEQPRQ